MRDAILGCIPTGFSDAAATRADAERLEFERGGVPFDQSFRAIASGDTELSHRIVLGALPQRPFAGIEIGLADLADLFGGIRIVSGGKHGGRRHLAEIHADDRRRPFRHVDFGNCLLQRARHLAARLGNVEP